MTFKLVDPDYNRVDVKSTGEVRVVDGHNAFVSIEIQFQP